MRTRATAAGLATLGAGLQLYAGWRQGWLLIFVGAIVAAFDKPSVTIR